MKSVFHEFFLDNEYILNLNFFDILVAIKEEQTLQEFNNGLTLHKKKKEPVPKVFCKNMCFKKSRKFHRKTLCLQLH